MRPSPLRRKLLLAALLPLLLTSAACNRDDNIGQTEDGRLVLGNAQAEEAVPRGVYLGNRDLVLDGFSGSVELTGTSGEAAQFTFTKRARGQDQEAAQEALREVTIEERGDAATYRYTLSSDQPEIASVDVRGSVPEGTNLRIQLEDGTVALSAIEGPITISGQSLESVRIGGATQSVDVETRNGTIELGMERLTDTSEVRLRTTNGDLLLSLPGAAAAAVVAQTATGEIEVEGLTFEDRNLDPSGTGARFSGQLGERGADVQLQTENGSVLLREGAVPTLAALGTFPREVAQVDPAPDTLRSAALLDGLTPDTLYTAADSALTPADSLAIPTAEDVDTTAVGVLPSQLLSATGDTAAARPDTAAATSDTVATRRDAIAAALAAAEVPDTTTAASDTTSVAAVPDTVAADTTVILPDTTTAAAPAPTPAQTAITVPPVPPTSDTTATSPDTTSTTPADTAATGRTSSQRTIIVPLVSPTSEDTAAARTSGTSVRRVAGSVDSLSAVTGRLSALADSIAASVDSLSSAVEGQER